MAKIIIHDNKFCQFLTEDEGEYKALKRFLSYKEEGVEYTAAFRNGWNGITYLISDKGLFYSGLLERVKTFCKDNAILLEEIVDKRKPVIKNEPLDISENLNKLGLIPRDYQIELVEKCLAVSKGVAKSATGSGKSLCAAMIVAKLNKPTILYCIGLDLLEQFHKLFSSIFDEKIGYIGNGICDIQRINIVSIWSVGSSLKLSKKLVLKDDEDMQREKELNEIQCEQVMKMLKTTQVHLIDECHVVATETIKRIYKAIHPEYLYGFSGTPFKNQDSDLLIYGILGEKVIDITASKLIEQGVLAKPYIKFLTVPKAPSFKQDTYLTVYKEYIVENAQRNKMIVDNTIKLVEKGYTPLVLFKQIKHGEILFEMMRDAGINCALLHGSDDTNKREEIKQLVADGKIKVLISSSIFDIGLDLPKLSALILASAGKSKNRLLQRAGRVIRKYPGKSTSAILDFVDQAKFLKKHSQMRYEAYKSEDGFIVSWPKGIK